MPILNMNYGANKGGANIGEPTSISATTTSDSATITWTDNDLNTIPPSTFFKSVLVRKVGSAPTSPSDGTTVVTETVKNTYSSSGYTDTGLTTGTTYYYQVFSYSDTGGITYGTPVSVTPQGGWTPGANTLIYLPLDSINQTTNLGTLNKIFTASSGTTRGTNYVEATSRGQGVYSYQTSPANDYSLWTVNAWCYITSFASSDNYASQIYGIGNYGAGDNKNLDMQGRTFSFVGNSFTSNYIDNYLNSWHNVVITSANAYIDGVPLTRISTGTSTTINTYNVFLLVNPRSPSSGTLGRISEFIFEDKERTAQEVSDYFDQTKANYGIS